MLKVCLIEREFVDFARSSDVPTLREKIVVTEGFCERAFHGRYRDFHSPDPLTADELVEARAYLRELKNERSACSADRPLHD